MGMMDESRWNTHQTDDATQKYLVNFFNDISGEPGFEDVFNCLTDAEREKLQKMNDRQAQLSPTHLTNSQIIQLS